MDEDWQEGNYRLIRHFVFSRYSGHERAIAERCANLAHWMHGHLMASEEMAKGLDDLLIARDRFIRACRDQGGVLLTEDKDYQRG